MSLEGHMGEVIRVFGQIALKDGLTEAEFAMTFSEAVISSLREVGGNTRRGGNCALLLRSMLNESAQSATEEAGL